MRLPKSKYKGIYPIFSKGKYIYWNAALTYKGIKRQKMNSDERKAAIYYDKMLIEIGKDPVNILTRIISLN